ncbi:MAG: DUF1932 domain-containing protein [Cellvibrionaceae bacterium]
MPNSHILTQGSLSVGFIGYGEAASAFVTGWRDALSSNKPLSNESPTNVSSLNIFAYDIKTDDTDTSETKWNDYKRDSIQGCRTLEELLNHASVIFSLVTPDQSLSVSKRVSDITEQNTKTTSLANVIFLDCNSCSPNSKTESEKYITQNGGRYIDVAVMSPVYPHKHQTPLLLSGEYSSDALKIVQQLNMNASIAGKKVGQASAIKMIRSIMVKGMEALTAECLLAAKKLGVDQQVLSSLQHSFPESNWEEKSFYNLERMSVHGVRRSAEMMEAANMLKDLQLDNSITLAASQWQKKIGDLKISVNVEKSSGNVNQYSTLSSEILNRLN